MCDFETSFNVIHNHIRRRHSNQVVPVLVWRNDKEALRMLERICAKSSYELLRSCLPRCMLVVLTTYANQKAGLPVDAVKMDQASACHDLLSEYFGEEVRACLCMHLCVRVVYGVSPFLCVHRNCRLFSESQWMIFW